MAKTRIMLRLDPDLLAAIDGEAGFGNRTAWITEACEFWLDNPSRGTISALMASVSAPEPPESQAPVLTPESPGEAHTIGVVANPRIGADGHKHVWLHTELGVHCQSCKEPKP